MLRDLCAIEFGGNDKRKIDACCDPAACNAIAINHDAFEDLTPDGLRRLARPDAVVCDIWNLLGTGKIVFSLAG